MHTAFNANVYTSTPTATYVSTRAHTRAHTHTHTHTHTHAHTSFLACLPACLPACLQLDQEAEDKYYAELQAKVGWVISTASWCLGDELDSVLPPRQQCTDVHTAVQYDLVFGEG